MKNTSFRTSRREFLASVSAVAATHLASPANAAPSKTFGIAFTSFPIRLRQASQAVSGSSASLSAEKFIELCQAFGADGCQMDLARLTSNDADYLKRIRAILEAKGMFLELAVSARTLGDSEALSSAAATARQLGVSRLRTAMLERASL